MILVTGASGPVGRAVIADQESMTRALTGVDVVYLVCSPIPAPVDLESNAIEACQETGAVLADDATRPQSIVRPMA